ncbi:MAG: hypothetical protein RBT13_08120 [Bacteroidales bacterium]|jgi:hypothetical protein|nr:hypothetical protein [Bacteroidales bacterium]
MIYKQIPLIISIKSPPPIPDQIIPFNKVFYDPFGVAPFHSLIIFLLTYNPFGIYNTKWQIVMEKNDYSGTN